MTIDEALGQLRSSFPTEATFQGIHFKFATNSKFPTLIEQKRMGRFYYWLLIDGKPVLFNASSVSKLPRMKTIGECFKGNFLRAYAE